MPGKKLQIVPVDQIPKEVTDVPTGDLLAVLGTCLQMAELCIKEHGIGLAAVQVGIPWKLFVVRYINEGTSATAWIPTNDQFRFFVNCRYVPLSEEKEKSLEGCLSIRRPNGDFRHFEVDRYKQVKVEGHELLVSPELKVEPVTVEPKGFHNFVFQHEIDHQDLVLISDIGVEYEVWK